MGRQGSDHKIQKGGGIIGGTMSTTMPTTVSIMERTDMTAIMLIICPEGPAEEAAFCAVDKTCSLIHLDKLKPKFSRNGPPGHCTPLPVDAAATTEAPPSQCGRMFSNLLTPSWNRTACVSVITADTREW
ncbi:hypothetical protein GNI_077730 [Gregarina niphandrodes]|uniref:Uncharacterized protein n=1 Tax=Gregarina niphandrodes TaxID=110365 RepID=A0A023B6S3_GRENI|nr:hypothetical protein GNI_077730 [Gregarina niphandrodes]EZG66684.1 hypothetical protein GNI_077730 [Gregarina niphandrodes]|eukprot:XP_011130535.1 hypothetical protein GNI_077730 [Gregarina niphandrodes]